MSEKFDAIIVGAGQAGPFLAARLTDAGQTVALIERKLVGGTCVNYGCIPTKTLVASAHTAHLARRGADYGIGTGDITVDMPKVKARKDKISTDDRVKVESWLEGMEGLTFIRGHARFEGPRTVSVDGRLLEAGKVFLNVGGRAAVPDMPGLSDIDYLTNVGILELDTVPEHLVVVGGSYIGLEFAQMYRRFDARVTVIEKAPRLFHTRTVTSPTRSGKYWRPRASMWSSMPVTFGSLSVTTVFKWWRAMVHNPSQARTY
jgi:pyruvate/2-oxoglutarate dehydrogenase complex dihydrolipoamide dehydrogenase (E3) component